MHNHPCQLVLFVSSISLLIWATSLSISCECKIFLPSLVPFIPFTWLETKSKVSPGYQCHLSFEGKASKTFICSSQHVANMCVCVCMRAFTVCVDTCHVCSVSRSLASKINIKSAAGETTVEAEGLYRGGRLVFSFFLLIVFSGSCSTAITFYVPCHPLSTREWNQNLPNVDKMCLKWVKLVTLLIYHPRSHHSFFRIHERAKWQTCKGIYRDN